MPETVSRRQDLAFQVAYSLFLERMAFRWYGRIDKLMSFLLLLSGMAVVAEALPATLTGFAVAVLTAWQLIYAPAAKSGAAKSAYAEYAKLFNRFGSLSDDEAAAELDQLRDQDSDPPACLQMPAYCAAARKLSVPPENIPPLNFWQRAAEWFCG